LRGLEAEREKGLGMTESWDQYRLRMEAKEAEKNREPNPMVRAFGRGPEGKICRECRHMIVKRFAKTYYKCRFRENTNGPGSDHRVRWSACVKFEEVDHESETPICGDP
jgi:hypothetical protein